jgi:hypothetical protein
MLCFLLVSALCLLVIIFDKKRREMLEEEEEEEEAYLGNQSAIGVGAKFGPHAPSLYLACQTFGGKRLHVLVWVLLLGAWVREALLLEHWHQGVLGLCCLLPASAVQACLAKLDHHGLEKKTDRKRESQADEREEWWGCLDR